MSPCMGGTKTRIFRVYSPMSFCWSYILLLNIVKSLKNIQCAVSEKIEVDHFIYFCRVATLKSQLFQKNSYIPNFNSIGPLVPEIHPGQTDRHTNRHPKTTFSDSWSKVMSGKNKISRSKKIAITILTLAKYVGCEKVKISCKYR